ncbi:MAG TPA: hypothetical protein VK761_08260, partial [Solirubrobacteraceae bacterium]|nr:hypothetical protein [Solirubrobacteraceae bacterium]
MPIVSAVGLAVLAGTTSHGEGGSAGWRSASFDFVILIIGFAIVGAALFVLGGSIETGRRLGPAGAKEENRLVVALFVLLGIVAVRKAWSRFFYSEQLEPWDRGLLDRVPQLLSFCLATSIVAVIGLTLDFVLAWMGA